MLSEIVVKRAPQSFQYISEEAVEKLLRMSSRESASGVRYLLGGAHGVGKSELIDGLSKKLGISSYSSGDVIGQSCEVSPFGKVADAINVAPSQDALIESPRPLRWKK